MSIRRLSVQYVGSTLRVPIFDTLERDVDCVVLNPHSGPRTFLPEDETQRLGKENGRLREMLRELYYCSKQTGCDHCAYADGCDMTDQMRKYGIEVNDEPE